ncbi:hypothetical protein KP509_38G023400 [Ceratopteris richardii]|nr:hypothetical protein KP509_38G023400 [Ceratopteris richardii]
MSPARFFMSPGRSTKWGSLFGSRKDSRSSTPRSSVYSEGEVSCFGWAFESRSMLHTDRTCAFLARSLNALHEYRSSEDICSIESCSDAQNNVYTVQTSERVDSDSLLTAIGEGCSSHMNEAYGHDRSCASLAVEGHDDEQKFSVQPEPCCSKESLVEDYNHDKPPKQKFMYNELPSLYCASSASQNMKISDDIVPETWLWRACERLQTDTASHLSCGSKQNMASSREDSETAKQVEVNCSPSSSAKPQDFTRIAQAVYQRTGLHNPHVDVSCSHTECTTDDEPVTKHDETNNNLEVSSRTECRHSDTTLLPSFVNIPVALLKEDREKFMGFSGFDEGIMHSDNREHKAFCEKLELEKGLQEPYHLKTSHRMMRQCVVDIGKEKYTIAFPQLYGKNQSPLSVEDGKQSWCIFKNRSRAYPPQSFSALILLGYNQSVSLKDVQNSDEEFLKGIFELGRLSFKGSSKYLQVLKADTAFNRSRSATSHRTLIRLQRCNSDPCRSSYWF